MTTGDPREAKAGLPASGFVLHIAPVTAMVQAQLHSGGTFLLVLIAVYCSSSSRLPALSAHWGMAFWQPRLPYRTLHLTATALPTAAPRYTILAGAHGTPRMLQAVVPRSS
jgi:hypothetical protein